MTKLWNPTPHLNNYPSNCVIKLHIKLHAHCRAAKCSLSIRSNGATSQYPTKHQSFSFQFCFVTEFCIFHKKINKFSYMPDMNVIFKNKIVHILQLHAITQQKNITVFKQKNIVFTILKLFWINRLNLAKENKSDYGLTFFSCEILQCCSVFQFLGHKFNIFYF